MRASRLVVFSTVLAACAAACNQIFGIEDPNLIDEPADAGSGDAAEGADSEPPTDASAEAPPDAPGVLPTRWMFAGLEKGTAEIAIATPADGGTSLVGRLTLKSTDALAYASGGRAFVLNREDGTVFVLDRANPSDVTKVARILTSPSGGAVKYDSNPYAVAVADDHDAFVIRYDENEIMVVDLTSEQDAGVLPVKKTIDLSVFNSSADGDGKVEMAGAVYSAARKRVYVVLQRILRTFPATCTDDALIVAIDVAKLAVADLNSSGGVDQEDAIKLVGKNPVSIALDEANDRLSVLNRGCKPPEASAIVGRQVDDVDLSTKSVTTAVADPGTDVIAFLRAGPTDRYLQQSDGRWKRLLGDGGLGAVATQIPYVPFTDREGSIVGLLDDTPDAATHGWSVYRFDRQAQLGGPVLPNVFSSVNVASVYLLSSALLQ